MFTIEVTSDATSLLSDAQRWNSLSRGVPFRETSWIGPWWRHFGRDGEAYIVVARDEAGQIHGLLPLYRRNAGPGQRTLAVMGDGNACSDHVSVLAQEPQLGQVGEDMGRFLASSAGCPRWGWDVLDVDGIVERDPGMTALAHGLESGGVSLHSSSRMSVWFKPRDTSWEEHLKQYGKTQRRKMRRWSEKIGEWSEFQQRSAQTETEAIAMIDALIAMHQKRWNEVGESGSFACPNFRRFIHDASQDFFSRGQLYVTSLEHHGQTVAAELSFIGGDGVMYVYCAGYDTAHAELEAGRILSVDSLRHLYRQSLSGIDYMRGDEEYKKRYATESRKLIRMRAVAPTLLPQLRNAAWRTGFELKQWARRQTGRQPITVLDLTQQSSSPLEHF